MTSDIKPGDMVQMTRGSILLVISVSKLFTTAKDEVRKSVTFMSHRGMIETFTSSPTSSYNVV
jgi:hypothetical protein